ncbi:MAG: AbrB/MazE/SpoVT family DNA-binding domain-containing protein [Gammaproteobacteria bacterium]|nr:AbrB/MazE/SpoVT family DNA-binding domain-containing protein [Gammaproteobacteria bacterium]
MRVAKWGNSLAVRLPKSLVDELGLKPGDRLDVLSARSDRIVVARDETKKKAVDRMRERALSIPRDYSFDRDEANAR